MRLGSHKFPPRNPPGVLVPSKGKPMRSTAHGMDQLQDRGYVPSVILQARRTQKGKKRQDDASWLHYDPINDIFAVFSKIGELIMAYPGPRGKR